MSTSFNIAIFASGAGTTLQTLIDEQSQHGYRVALVVTNRPCPAQERAEQAHIPAIVSKDWEEIDKALMYNHIQLVVLAGFLAIIPEWICRKWEHRIINIHPSLLPAFRGANAVEQAIEYGVKVFGITIHWVDESLDGGKIIAQEAFAYEGNDAAEVHRIGQAIEHRLYPETIKKILNE